jgi:hypothetical protein
MVLMYILKKISFVAISKFNPAFIMLHLDVNDQIMKVMNLQPMKPTLARYMDYLKAFTKWWYHKIIEMNLSNICQNSICHVNF